MNATMTAATTSTAEQLVLDVLLISGFRQRDGWFYPAGDPDRAAVRLSVFGGQYQIWRRRRLEGAWMLIATADCSNFDQTAFHTWRSSWPLVH